MHKNASSHRPRRRRCLAPAAPRRGRRRCATVAGFRPHRPLRSPPASGYHTVRPGDTLLGIARQYGVTCPIWCRGTGSPTRPDPVGQSLRVSPSASTGSIGGWGPSRRRSFDRLRYGPDRAGTGRRPCAGDRAAAVESPPPAAAEAPPSTMSGQWRWPASGSVIAGFNGGFQQGARHRWRGRRAGVCGGGRQVVHAGSGLRGYGKLIVIKHNQEYNSVCS